VRQDVVDEIPVVLPCGLARDATPEDEHGFDPVAHRVLGEKGVSCLLVRSTTHLYTVGGSIGSILVGCDDLAGENGYVHPMRKGGGGVGHWHGNLPCSLVRTGLDRGGIAALG
jgi:hypothetical protein